MIVSLPHRRTQWLALLLASLSAAAGLAIAAHHPLSAPAALLAWLVVAAASTLPHLQIPLLLGLLPLVGLAPWTGWLTFEEMDLLVLAAAAGGYLAIALRPGERERAPVWRRLLDYSPLARLLIALFAGSLLLALWRGLADAGGWRFGWFQGYHEPMNSLRAVKSWFLMLWLLPVWVEAGARQPPRVARALLLGMLLALGGAAAAAFYERLAYAGLLDVSNLYRTTALFWEMHVGGAALAAWLVMGMPFAVLALLRARRPLHFGLAMALVLLAGYAALTTFSRGVYVGVPAGIVVLIALRGLQRNRVAAQPLAATALPWLAKLGGLLIALAFGLAAVTMFEAGSYRGLLALLGAALVLMLMPASLWLPAPQQRLTALLMGALLAALLAGASWAVCMFVPRAAYAFYALALIAALALRAKDRPGVAQPIYLCLVTASFFWLLACLVFVADSWGGPASRGRALPALVLPGLLWAWLLLQPALWPLRGQGPQWRSRGLLIVGLLLAGAIVAALGGGKIVRERMAGVDEDMRGRVAHWRQGLAMLDRSTDLLLGQGAGRFVANHFFAADVAEHTGDYRLREDGGARHLVLTGGRTALGEGGRLRISQRIRAPQGPLKLQARLRTAADLNLAVEICDKHLLYASNCLSEALELKAGEGWQDAELELGNAPPLGGTALLPRWVVFSIAVETDDGRVDIGALRLHDGNGPLLANPEFKDELARWFFSSDRHHLPWHIKNVFLHVLVEQGVIGLALFAGLLLLGFWRMSVGSGREHALAPALAAALTGFVAVGLFDSLLDIPRVAFLFALLLLMSLGLRALPPEGAGLPQEVPRPG